MTFPVQEVLDDKEEEENEDVNHLPLWQEVVEKEEEIKTTAEEEKKTPEMLSLNN